MVQNGQQVNAQVTNAAFVSRTTDSDTVGKVGLKNTAVESGALINNAQAAINKAFEAAGIANETDSTVNNYANENYISNGDNRKVAIGKLDAQIKLTQDELDAHEAATTAALALKYDASNPDGYQTEADVDAKIAALVDSSPAALDTLNELAAALGDDPNFATTVTTSLAGKEPTITATTSADYYRGDKTFQPLNAAAVGLSNVTNDAQLKRSANDFNTFTEKTTIAANDVFIIEDSAASGAKKFVKASSITSVPAAKIKAIVSQTSGQSISSGVFTKITANVIESDPDTIFDTTNNHFVQPADGTGNFNGLVHIDAAIGNATIITSVYKNGNLYKQKYLTITPITNYYPCEIKISTDGVIGDTWDLRVWQNVGARSISTDQTHNQITFEMD